MSLFKKYVYGPILSELIQKTTIKNSIDYLGDAIKRGSLKYTKGGFSGRLNANLTKELKKIGATWDRTDKSFKIAYTELPKPIRAKVDVSEAKFQYVLSRIDRKIKKLDSSELLQKIDVSSLFDTTIFRVNKKIESQLKKVSIRPPTMTPQQLKKIADQYANNTKLTIKGWLDKEITELREDVQKNFHAGIRYDDMFKKIQDKYQVSASKAKFLARQETNLLTAKFKETRYMASGLNKYRWQCVVGSPKHPVRPAHKALDGKIFRFDTPPVTSEPGEKIRRNNPSEDYNCRCASRVIIK